MRVARLRGFREAAFFWKTGGRRGQVEDGGGTHDGENSPNLRRLRSLEGRETEDQSGHAAGQRDQGGGAEDCGKGIQADDGGVFETAADGAGSRAGDAEGDQGDMGGTGDDNDIRRIEIAYDPLPSQKLFHESDRKTAVRGKR